MSYVVLARKLRPTRFGDLIGQESIAQTLKNAIQINRVAHAFLLTGTRGVGKTSCARILAKALNCLEQQDYEPCNQCINCIEITNNRATDVIEIDAASNRGIEHMRELRENINFTAAKSRYKIYIIDEVHMLTTEAFNALLKTLEEPPDHVKFILATTDPHKVPATITSRCQRFDFQPISIPKIKQFLQEIIAREKVSVDETILRQVAKNAAGSMRDALTSLDMLISLGGKTIDKEMALSILGTHYNDEILQLYLAIIDNQAKQAFQITQSLLKNGTTVQQILDQLSRIVQNISLAKTINQKDIFWQDYFEEEIEQYKSLGERLSHSILQQQFQLILDLEQQIKKSNYAQACFQMGVIRLMQIENLINVRQIVQSLKELEKHSINPIPKNEQKTGNSLKERVELLAHQQTLVSDTIKNQETKEHLFEHDQNYQHEKNQENKSNFVEEENFNSAEETVKQTDEVNHDFITQPVSAIAQNQEEATREITAQRVKEQVTSFTNDPQANQNEIRAKEPSIENWQWFMETIKDDCDSFLLAMLGNFRLIEFNQERLVVTSEAGAVAKILTSDHIKKIEELLQKYFRRKITVKIDADGVTDHQSRHDLDQIRKEQERTIKEEAILNSPVVKEILNLEGTQIKQFNIKE